MHPEEIEDTEEIQEDLFSAEGEDPKDNESKGTQQYGLVLVCYDGQNRVVAQSENRDDLVKNAENIVDREIYTFENRQTGGIETVKVLSSKVLPVNQQQ